VHTTPDLKLSEEAFPATAPPLAGATEEIEAEAVEGEAAPGPELPEASEVSEGETAPEPELVLHEASSEPPGDTEEAPEIEGPAADEPEAEVDSAAQDEPA
jgi:hypothetical protein